MIRLTIHVIIHLKFQMSEGRLLVYLFVLQTMFNTWWSSLLLLGYFDDYMNSGQAGMNVKNREKLIAIINRHSVNLSKRISCWNENESFQRSHL